MKKNLLMLALLLPAMTGWAQTDAIKASTSVDSPENLFTMKNGNGLTMTSFTSPTETEGMPASLHSMLRMVRRTLTTSTAWTRRNGCRTPRPPVTTMA